MSPTAAKPRARARAHRRDVFHRGTQDFRQLGRLDKRESFSRSVFAHDMGMSLQRGPKRSLLATPLIPIRGSRSRLFPKPVTGRRRAWNAKPGGPPNSLRVSRPRRRDYNPGTLEHEKSTRIESIMTAEVAASWITRLARTGQSATRRTSDPDHQPVSRSVPKRPGIRRADPVQTSPIRQQAEGDDSLRRFAERGHGRTSDER